jgi:hypothetical protein
VLSVSRDPADVREAYERAAASPRTGSSHADIASLRPPPGDGRQRFSHPIIAIGADAKGTRNETLAQQLIRDYDFPDVSWPLASALLHVGGETADRWLLKVLPEQTPITRAEIAWALEGWTLERLLSRCHESGLIAATPDREMVRRAWVDCWAGDDDNDFHLFEPFVTLLVEVGTAVHFSYDPSRPICYDSLIHEFNRCMPWFHLEALSETVLGESNEEGRLVQFVVGDARYRLEMGSSHGRYTYGSDIAALLNRALEDHGRGERFAPIRKDEQFVFVFGPHDVLRELAHSIYLPLVEEPQIAERAVQEFIARRTRS